MRPLIGLFVAALLTACSDASAPVTPEQSPSAQRPVALLSSSDGSIPGNYIVVANWSASVPDILSQYGIAPKHVYQHLLNGFAGAFPSSIAEALATDPRVLRISVQRQIKTVETVTQAGATWGLDRIDQRALPVDGNYAYEFSGAGVTAYIIDTGIRYSHSEFEGRASPGYNVFAADPTDPVLGYDGGNCEGHGTHVAGTVGGRTWGVAKQVRLVGVRVARTTWTNYGACIDIFAPGSSIMSSTFDDDNSSGVKSGTSMAAPHVAGAAALVLQQAPGATPGQVRDYLVNQSTKNIITPVTLNSGHTMNSHLLYSRTVVPAEVVGKPPKHLKPCTPKRQRDGEC